MLSDMAYSMMNLITHLVKNKMVIVITNNTRDKNISEYFMTDFNISQRTNQHSYYKLNNV